MKKNSSNKTPIFFLILSILVLGFLLRIYNIEEKAIWYDEADGIYCAQKPITFFASPLLIYKPFYFFLLKLWMFCFGSAPTAVRFFSVIPATLSIFFIYKLGDMLFGKRVGAISAYLLAISCFNIFHAQQVRHFSLIVLLSTLSFIALVNYIRLTKLWYLNHLGAVNLLIVLTHPYGNVLVLSQCLFLGFFEKEILNRKRWILPFILLPVFASGFILIAVNQQILDMIWWIPEGGLGALKELFATLNYGGLSYGLQNFRIDSSQLAPAHLLALLFIPLFFYGMAYRNNSLEQKESLGEGKGKILLLVWMFVPVLLAFLLSWIKPIFVIKHLIFISVPYYIIVARGVSRLRSPALKTVILLVIMLLSFTPLSVMYNNDFQSDWRNTAYYLKDRLKPGTLVVLSTNKEMLPFFYYFTGPDFLFDLEIYDTEEDQDIVLFPERNVIFIGLDERRQHHENYVQVDFMDKMNSLSYSQKKTKEAWVLFSRWGHDDDYDFITAYFKGVYKSMDEKNHSGIRVAYFHDSR